MWASRPQPWRTFAPMMPTRIFPVAMIIFTPSSASSLSTGGLERPRPPEQVIDHHTRGLLELREPLVDVAALELRHQGRNWDMDGRSNRGELDLYRRFAELLHAARASDAAIAHESNRLAVPFRIDPVDRVLQDGGRAVVILRGDEDEAVRRAYRGGPFADNLILIRRASGPGGAHSLVKEGHRKVSQVEQPRIDVALLETLENPLRWFFRKTTLPRTAYDHRNYDHLIAPCDCSNSRIK